MAMTSFSLGIEQNWFLFKGRIKRTIAFTISFNPVIVGCIEFYRVLIAASGLI